MRTPASQRRTTFTRLLLALVLSLTQLGTALHFALVRHAMASDGALVHTTHDDAAAPDTVSGDTTVTQLPSAGCAVAALQRAAFEAPAPSETLSTVAAVRELPALCHSRVCDSSGTYRLAPKSSPPVS